MYVRGSFSFRSAGIGYQITKQLAAKGATIYLACRSEERASAAIGKLEDEVPSIVGRNKLHFLQVDMSDVRSVRRAADEFVKRETRLDVLCAHALYRRKIGLAHECLQYIMPDALLTPMSFRKMALSSASLSSAYTSPVEPPVRVDLTKS